MKCFYKRKTKTKLSSRYPLIKICHFFFFSYQFAYDYYNSILSFQKVFWNMISLWITIDSFGEHI